MTDQRPHDLGPHDLGPHDPGARDPEAGATPIDPGASPRRPRRSVLKAVGVIAVGATGVATAAACAPDEAGAPNSSAPQSSAPPSSSAPSSSAASSSAPSSSAPSSSASSSVAIPDGIQVKKADVPKGGGIILTDDNFVVTQPESGTYKAFTKICTHQKCPVTKIEGTNIICECHGSSFSIVDGSVTNPPATEGLAESKVQVAGDVVVIIP